MTEPHGIDVGFRDLPASTGAHKHGPVPVFRDFETGGAAGGRDGAATLIPGKTSSDQAER
jgi:hypothetical protein